MSQLKLQSTENHSFIFPSCLLLLNLVERDRMYLDFLLYLLEKHVPETILISTGDVCVVSYPLSFSLEDSADPPVSITELVQPACEKSAFSYIQQVIWHTSLSVGSSVQAEPFQTWHSLETSIDNLNSQDLTATWGAAVLILLTCCQHGVL